jgi:hypothetical protein
MRPQVSFENESKKSARTKHTREALLVRLGIAKNNKSATIISLVILIACVCIIIFTQRFFYADTDTDDLPPRNVPATDVKRS